MYKAYADHLASWGYAVMQVRPYHSALAPLGSVKHTLMPMQPGSTNRACVPHCAVQPANGRSVHPLQRDRVRLPDPNPHLVGAPAVSTVGMQQSGRASICL